MTENLQKRAVIENFLKLHDDSEGSIILNALDGRLITSGNEGIQHFIEGMTGNVEPVMRGRTVSLLAGIIAKSSCDIDKKKKKIVKIV